MIGKKAEARFLSLLAHNQSYTDESLYISEPPVILYRTSSYLTGYAKIVAAWIWESRR